MATEPLDGVNDSELLERRRWGSVTKVYTRKNKGQRNSNSSVATTTSLTTAATSEPATVSVNDEVSKRMGTGNGVLCDEAQEGCKKGLLSVDDGNSRQPDCPEQVALSALPSENEEVEGRGVTVSTSKGPPVDSKEVIVPSENGDGEAVDQEVEVDQLGQEAGDSPRENAAQENTELLMDGKEAVVPSEIDSRVEREEGSCNSVLQSSTEVVERDKLSQDVGDSHGGNANQNGKDLGVAGKEVLLSSRDDDQSQHEDGPSHGETIRPCSNDMLPESEEVSLVKEDQLGQATADGHIETTRVSGKAGQLGHEEATTHVETALGSDGVLKEKKAVVVPQEDGGTLEQAIGASSGETVRICDEESPESREVVVPPHSSGCDIADANGVVSLNKPQPDMQELPSVMIRIDDKLRINVAGARSSNEIRGVKRKLETELDQVRSLFKKLQAKELQVTSSNYNTDNGIISNVETINTNSINRVDSSTRDEAPGNFNAYIQPEYAMNDAVERTLTRVSSEVGSVLHRSNKLFNRSLSVSMVDNDHGVGDFMEREKRTPKANQLYRNSEFLLGKDRLPPESNKKLKANGVGRKDAEIERRFGLASFKNRERAFKSCSSLLQRLMKHNFGWVFNEPVDVKKLGLHDYHDIIKNPMDLGTIKARLSLNYYKSPIEYADDVRLVFRNAMTYNPKGHDVNLMAETLLRMFEERWMVIETEYNIDFRYQMYQDAGLPAPMSRNFPATQFQTPAQIPTPVHPPAHVQAPPYASVTPVPQRRTLENLQPMAMNTTPNLRPSSYVGRTPAPKKPKARDLNKRDMTYDEKQKLSTNLQNLPTEKLDAIVQIIKRRSSALSQNNDEIEVDIDSVDTETLWELDRFITNYKKSLSKNKRKAELALLTQAEALRATAVMNTLPATVDMQKETRIGENNDPPVEVERQGDHDSRSSSSSSSSSSSGSSSSDSDSDSSSSCGSDSRRSPRT
ncbi:hypothetical protein LIER_32453 [Lithospermum erythrorhizon]|uniref:Uncharacterized protein n=1 Tax=Lithospermum erythrorhizon TaxID=34254 RepID=A0AAV3RXC2_LITER